MRLTKKDSRDRVFFGIYETDEPTKFAHPNPVHGFALNALDPSVQQM